MIDWLVIGAGMHGMAVAVALGRVGASEVRILDPHAEPLARWRRRTAAVEMTALRSPALHHLDPVPASLFAYAAAVGRRLPGTGVPPPLDLFDAHARWVLERAGLWAPPMTGEARALIRRADGWRVETDRGPLDARRVVLAVGGGERGRYPAWATELAARGAPVHHVFDPDYAPRRSGPIAVVGGGLSGAQVALAASARGQEVVLVTRRPLRVSPYDADSCWFDPASAAVFGRTPDPAARRDLIRRGRHRGAITPVASAQLSERIGDGRVTVISEPLRRATPVGPQVQLVLGETAVTVDAVVLTTGFDRVPPHGWISRSARALGLPVTPDGTPLPGPSLQWAPGLFVCGGLAELELGPTARSLAGGRRAAQILALQT